MQPLEMPFDVDWRPGIGDPTIMGWATVLAYFSVALLAAGCVRYLARQKHADVLQQQRRMWGILAILFLLLGVNKQINFISWFTAAGRDVAWSQSRQPSPGIEAPRKHSENE